MKAIHADPREIRKVFAEKYIIPDFQRPYSWDIEQCDKLLEDLFYFFNENESKGDRYFLGNLVIHPSEESLAVIDGQQRLTTLLLLIKVLHKNAGVVKALEECLKTKNPLTSELTNELRVSSEVIADDKKYLYDIIFNNGNTTPPDIKLKVNFIHIEKKITEWWLSVGNSTDKLEKFILTILDQVVLLPIHCSSQDDALIIFETINNRGMSLTDADIFKAKLHGAAQTEKDVFIRRWNSLGDHEWLFRVYMHVLRSDKGDVGKEIALRHYFLKEERLKDWKKVVNSIGLIYDIENTWQASDDVEIMWRILSSYPNYYWNFPLFVFLHKYGVWKEDNFTLSYEYDERLFQLIKETVKYFFIKGIVYNSVNAVKDTVFKVCASIAKEEDYIGEYQKSLGNDRDEFLRRIENKQYGRYLRGLVLLTAYLNPLQNKGAYKQVVKNGCHIEHILPKKWNNYDYWNADTHKSNLDDLGNLMPLEFDLNISARNEFFSRKKESYKKSGVQDALDLLLEEDWHPDNFARRQVESQKRLLSFFMQELQHNPIIEIANEVNND